MKQNFSRHKVVVDGCCENKSRKNHETRREEVLSPNSTIFLSLDEFLCFEIASEVKHLPCCETKKTTHAEYTKEQYSVVC